MKLTNKSKIVGTLAVTLAACVVCAEYSPVANVPETWGTDANWLVAGKAVRVYTPGQMGSSNNVSSGVPLPGMSAVVANGASSGGRYVGDYVGSAITHVAFDAKRVGLGSAATLNFTTTSGDRWTCRFALPQAVGVWEHVEIPVQYSPSWLRNDQPSDAGAFDQARVAIADLDILTQFNGTGEQSLFIDNFKVVGPWEKGPMTADKMPENWLMVNGLPVADGQAGLDADGDGFCNYAEYLAGTNPNDAASRFRVEIDKDGDGNPVLRWKHEAYRSYTVLRSSDLVSGTFESVQAQVRNTGASDEAAAPADAGTVFFKVGIAVQ